LFIQYDESNIPIKSPEKGASKGHKKQRQTFSIPFLFFLFFVAVP